MKIGAADIYLKTNAHFLLKVKIRRSVSFKQFKHYNSRYLVASKLILQNKSRLTQRKPREHENSQTVQYFTEKMEKVYGWRNWCMDYDITSHTFISGSTKIICLTDLVDIISVNKYQELFIIAACANLLDSSKLLVYLKKYRFPLGDKGKNLKPKPGWMEVRLYKVFSYLSKMNEQKLMWICQITIDIYKGTDVPYNHWKILGFEIKNNLLVILEDNQMNWLVHFSLGPRERQKMV